MGKTGIQKLLKKGHDASRGSTVSNGSKAPSVGKDSDDDDKVIGSVFMPRPSVGLPKAVVPAKEQAHTACLPDVSVVDQEPAKMVTRGITLPASVKETSSPEDSEAIEYGPGDSDDEDIESESLGDPEMAEECTVRRKTTNK
jgi:hypothetical protein